MRRFLPLFALALFALIGCNPPAAPQQAPATVDDGILDQAKAVAAANKADNLRMYSRSFEVRNDFQPVSSLDLLAEYAEDGENALFDPWGQRFQFTYVDEGDNAGPRIVIWTTHPKTGKVYASPPHLADKVKPGK